MENPEKETSGLLVWCCSRYGLRASFLLVEWLIKRYCGVVGSVSTMQNVDLLYMICCHVSEVNFNAGVPSGP